MKYLHKEFVQSAKCPNCLGSFVIFLKDKGWKQIEVQNSGPRSLDRWVLESPAGERFEFINWHYGQKTVKTSGGIVVLSDHDMRLETVNIPCEDVGKAVLRRRVEDALRKNPAFAMRVIKFALVTKAIRE